MTRPWTHEAVLLQGPHLALPDFESVCYHFGGQPCWFESPVSACRWLEGRPSLDLLVAELSCANFDAWGLCRALRSPRFERFRHTPILLVSATLPPPTAREAAAHIGANAVVTAPTGHELRSILAELMAGNLPPELPRALLVGEPVPGSKEHLQAHGYIVQEAACTEQALDRLEEQTCQLVVCGPGLGAQGCERVCSSLGAWSVALGFAPSVAGLTTLRQGASCGELVEAGESLRRQACLLEMARALEQKAQAGQVSRARETSASEAAAELAQVMDTRYRIVADNTYEWEFWLSPGGDFLYSSPSCNRVTGFDARDFEDDPTLIEQLVVEEDRPEFKGNWAPANWDLDLHRFSFRIRHRDDSIRWLEHTSQGVFDARGNFLGMRGTHRDVTEHHLARLERDRMQDDLRQAQKMEAIGMLAGGIAHDFNNVISCVLGYSSLVKLDFAPDHEVYQAMEVIEKAGCRAADLTRQLLGFARRGKLQNIPVSMRVVVDAVVQLLAHTVDRQIVLEVEPQTEEDTVQGDPSQLEQVLLNLGINARDAIGGRPGRIRFVIEPAPKDGFVSVSVEDDGCGIRGEDLDRIFEPFFSTKESGKGSGMGLATVYGIVANHGGRVEVHSTPGAGTKFSVVLPLARSGEGADLSAGAGLEGCTIARRTTVRTLVVDDDALVRGMLVRMLRQLGHHVVEVVDGAEACAYFEQYHREVDLVVLDVIMPVMSGPECFERLRRINPRVRVLLSTGYGPEGKVQGLLDDGLVAISHKPFRFSELSASIARLLEMQPE